MPCTENILNFLRLLLLVSLVSLLSEFEISAKEDSFFLIPKALGVPVTTTTKSTTVTTPFSLKNEFPTTTESETLFSEVDFDYEFNNNTFPDLDFDYDNEVTTPSLALSLKESAFIDILSDELNFKSNDCNYTNFNTEQIENKTISLIQVYDLVLLSLFTLVIILILFTIAKIIKLYKVPNFPNTQNV